MLDPASHGMASSDVVGRRSILVTNMGNICSIYRAVCVAGKLSQY